ncbi:MAG TPA: SDR family oxidoreductase [Aquihabitans sp.]|nr:SDR family oxidoreductase [Aquihabitans sp.]
MEIRLDGRTALVTGASRGIGRAVARGLAAAGADVVLSSRKLDVLEATAAELRTELAELGDRAGELAVVAANAGDPDAAAAAVDATLERFGAVDILVNNAATNPYFGHAIDIELGAFDKTVEVNWRGPLLWSQLAWRRWMQEHGGVICNVASIGGMSVETNIGVYNGTKAALLHLTRTLAAELAPGVRVNAVAPGLVKTDMARALWEPHEEAIARQVPLARLGEPVDIADATVFLCSDAASWITGTSLVVDGGMLLQA